MVLYASKRRQLRGGHLPIEAAVPYSPGSGEEAIDCIEECPWYNECGSCSHALAAEHHLDMLTDSVTSYKKEIIEKMIWRRSQLTRMVRIQLVFVRSCSHTEVSYKIVVSRFL